MMSKNCDSVVDLQFEMHRLCDGDIRREIITIPASEFKCSVSFLQELIETRFNIPLICQVGLSMSEIALDSLSPQSDLFSNRLCKRGERIVLSLKYYTNSSMVRPIHKMITAFREAITSDNYRIIYVILNTLNHDHVNGEGWQSNEAIGTRLYLTDCKFLPLLFNCVRGLLQRLSELYQEYHASVSEKSTDIAAQQLQLGKADSVTQALDAALGLLWNFGANSTDRILLFERGFLGLSQSCMQLAYHLICCPYEEFNGNGKALFGRCLGVIQGYSELRTPAIYIGNNINFLNLILYFITNPADYNREQLEPVLQVLIFFSCSSQNEISKILVENDFYQNLLRHFSGGEITRDYSYMKFEVFYIVSLLMLNWMKTPNGMQFEMTNSIQELLILFTKFSKKVEVENIVTFEEDTRFIWGSLDPFVSFFFIPKNSFIGCVLSNIASYSANVQELCQRYFELALFSLDVLLSREENRKQLIQERLLSHLIIAHWYLPYLNILPRIKQCYPELPYLPVPSLYDTAAMQAVCQGFRHFTEVIYPTV